MFAKRGYYGGSGAKLKKHLSVPRKELVAFCKRNNIRSLALFGSVLRDDFRQDSDVDVLVSSRQARRQGSSPSQTWKLSFQCFSITERWI
jgi:predicted nucleotidyltransferase